MDTCFSVGVAITEPVRAAIEAITGEVWCPALHADGQVRDGAQIAEITGMVDPQLLANYPAGTRMIARRERPHPGAQLDLFDTVNGMRHQVFATDTPAGPIQYLEAGTAPTPGSRTGSAAVRTPASAGFPPACSRSTPPGWSWR